MTRAIGKSETVVEDEERRACRLAIILSRYAFLKSTTDQHCRVQERKRRLGDEPAKNNSTITVSSSNSLSQCLIRREKIKRIKKKKRRKGATESRQIKDAR